MPREQDNGNSSSNNNGRGKNANKRQAREPAAPRQNTAVYVTGLPLDATAEEVHDLFSRKCGVIAEEIDSGRPRIKMYTDANGNFKGDALVVFFKPQSVEMAVMLLDDSDFRFGESGSRMRVMPADSSYKKTNNDAGSNSQVAGPAGGKKNTVITGDEPRPGEGGGEAAGGSSSHGNGNGAHVGSAEHARQRQNHQERQKIIRRTQKLTAKLADWDDDEPSSLPTGRPNVPEAKAGSKRWDKVVILTHMFTLQELEEDPAALLDIKEDIRDECAKLGEVTNVVLFDQEEEGIVSVKFATPEAAEACVRVMHGRSFDGRTVEAYFATGKERFRKSKTSGVGEDEEGEHAEG